MKLLSTDSWASPHRLPTTRRWFCRERTRLERRGPRHLLQTCRGSSCSRVASPGQVCRCALTSLAAYAQLQAWVMRKFKSFGGHKTRARHFLMRLAGDCPGLDLVDRVNRA